MKFLLLPVLLLVCIPLGSKPAQQPVSTSWETLTRQPTRQLGTRIRVVAQFQAGVTQWNPYLTRFNAVTHDGWQLWSDAQELWVRDEYEAPRVRVFSAKGGELSKRMAQLGSQQRVELELIVRECFLELPWAELVGMRVLDESVGEATVFHAARAIELERSGSLELALSELKSALVPGLPEHSRVALEALEVQWRARLGPVRGN